MKCAGHRIYMLSRYFALGFVSDFDCLPESRILKFLLRTFEFLPNKPRFDIPRAWEQLQPSNLTENQPFKGPQNKRHSLEAEDTSAPWWSITKSSRRPLGAGFPWTAALTPPFIWNIASFIWNIASAHHLKASLLPLPIGSSCSSCHSCQSSCPSTGKPSWTAMSKQHLIALSVLLRVCRLPFSPDFFGKSGLLSVVLLPILSAMYIKGINNTC